MEKHKGTAGSALRRPFPAPRNRVADIRRRSPRTAKLYGQAAAPTRPLAQEHVIPLSFAATNPKRLMRLKSPDLFTRGPMNLCQEQIACGCC